MQTIPDGTTQINKLIIGRELSFRNRLADGRMRLVMTHGALHRG